MKVVSWSWFVFYMIGTLIIGSFGIVNLYNRNYIPALGLFTCTFYCIVLYLAKVDMAKEDGEEDE